jgi:hypothetical protein
MLYSKNGSIPKPWDESAAQEGWIQVEPQPVAPEGKEVVWWYPPGWVIRDPMPVREGYTYNWSQSEERWVETSIETQNQEVVIDLPLNNADSIIGGNGNDTLEP